MNRKKSLNMGQAKLNTVQQKPEIAHMTNLISSKNKIK